MIVAVDTMVLIWGFRHLGAKRGNPRQKDLIEMQQRAGILLDMLDLDKAQIVVPTVMLAELLAGVEPHQHGDFIADVQRKFFCPPFDLRASAIAAKLWIDQRGMPKGERLQRNTLKVDVMILATAKTVGARRYYSHDHRSRKLATHIGIEAEDLPRFHSSDMFKDAEMKKSLEDDD